MKRKIFNYMNRLTLCLLGLMFLCISCSKQAYMEPTDLNLNLQFTSVQTRAGVDKGFKEGSGVGVYMRERVGDVNVVFNNKFNLLRNVKFYLTDGKWTTSRSYKWASATTPYDLFAYYPGMSLSNLNKTEIRIAKDQSTEDAVYSSDFLFKRINGLTYKTNTQIELKHMLVKLVVSFENLPSDVQLQELKFKALNVPSKAYFNFNTEVLTGDEFETSDIQSYIDPQTHKAEIIIAPGSKDAGEPLFELTIPEKNGSQYKLVYKLSEKQNWEQETIYNYTFPIPSDK